MAELTTVYEQIDGWWIGWVEDIPGTNVQERTLEEARVSLGEVTQLVLESNVALSE